MPARGFVSVIVRTLVFLLMIGLLVGGAAWSYNAGVSQGYAQGLAAAAAQADGAAPALPPGYAPYLMRPYFYGPHFGFSPFGGFLGFFFTLGLGLMFLFFIGGMFRMAFGWRRWGGHGHGPWSGGWQHGPQPGEKAQPEGAKPTEG